MKTSMQEEKSQLMAYCLWGLGIVGISGMHSLYLGKYKRGTLQLLTLGGLGILQLIDLFSLALEVRKLNEDEGHTMMPKDKTKDDSYKLERKNSDNDVLTDVSLEQLEAENAELQKKLMNLKD